MLPDITYGKSDKEASSKKPTLLLLWGQKFQAEQNIPIWAEKIVCLNTLDKSYLKYMTVYRVTAQKKDVSRLYGGTSSYNRKSQLNS